MPELRDEIGVAQQEIYDAGTDVGVLAQQYFPGGVSYHMMALAYQSK
jgi:hypothetical protein